MKYIFYQSPIQMHRGLPMHCILLLDYDNLKSTIRRADGNQLVLHWPEIVSMSQLEIEVFKATPHPFEITKERANEICKLGWREKFQEVYYEVKMPENASPNTMFHLL